MTPAPKIQPLPYKSRQHFFLFLLVLFLLTLPVVAFYSNGYRLDFSSTKTQIVSTGGLYISVNAREADIYIDNKLERDLRIFRPATYIQNLESGMHQVSVQQTGVQTWVKKLPVYPHIVTEAQVFSMPVIPRVRLISEYETLSGGTVVILEASTTPVLAHAVITNKLFATTSNATSTYKKNSEYTFVSELFAQTIATSTDTLIERVVQEIDNALTFDLDTTNTTSALERATSTKKLNDVLLFKQKDEVYIRWIGNDEDVPYYYCVNYTNATTTAFEYGTHVSVSLEEQLASSTVFILNDGDKICRSEIRIDRKWQDVIYFDFFPGNSDLILMHLTDGLYVVEVDDRGWQNTQLLYPGENISVLLNGDRIFIQDGEYTLEVFTELP